MTVREHLESLRACPDAVEWASRYKTVAGAWQACKRAELEADDAR